MDEPLIFIRAANDDRHHAEELYAALDREDLRAWYDPIDLIPGAHWDTAIPAALDESTVVAVIVSHRWAESPDGHYPREEAARAIQSGQRVVPILVDVDRSALPFGLMRFHPIHLGQTGWPNVAVQLRRAVEGAPDPNRVSLNSRISRLTEKEKSLRFERASVEEIRAVTGQRIALVREQRAGREVRPRDRLCKGRYWPRERIGRGAWGDVWRAEDMAIGSAIAIKILHPHLSQDSTARTRFQRGASILHRLTHSAIVSVVEPMQVDKERYIIAMELMARDLDQAILSPESVFSQEQALSAILQVSEGVRHAHATGVVHRDIKPKNILLDESGKTAKLTDFDLVRHDDDTHGTRTGQLGSLPYCAPEQILRAQDAGPAADIFSLGMSLLFVLKRERLPARLGRSDLGALIKALPVWPQLRKVVRKATQWEADKRHGSADAFCDDLRAAIAARPTNHDLDSLLASINSHRQCIEPDLYDLLSIPKLRQHWVRIPTSFPEPSTRRFLSDALWSDEQTLVQAASQTWVETARPWLEELAYADWQTRRGDSAPLQRAARPHLPTATRSTLQQSGWLDPDDPSGPSFSHWRLAVWALASAVARRGSPPEALLERLDTQMTNRLTAKQALAEPERSSELPGDLLWHYIHCKRFGDAVTIIRLMWDRGWRVDYLRELFIEIGPACLPAIQAHLECDAADGVSDRSESHYCWFERQTPTRIAEKHADDAASWAMSAVSHPNRNIRALSYEVATVTRSSSLAECLIARYEECRRQAGPLEQASRGTLEEEEWYYEGRRALKALQLFVAANPLWFAAKSKQLVVHGRDLACKVANGLSGQAGREAWLQAKQWFSAAGGAHDRFLTVMSRRFRDISEVGRLRHWIDELLRGNSGDKTSVEPSRVHDLRDLLETLAVLSPSAIPTILESMPKALLAAVSPGRILLALHLRDVDSYERSLRLWTSAANEEGMSYGWRLDGLADRLPPDILGSMVAELESHWAESNGGAQRPSWLIDCLASAQSLAALHLLESKAGTQLATAIANLAASQLTDRFGHIMGACDPLIRRIGGDAYREYTHARLEHGELEYRRGIHHLPFLPPPVDWERVLAAASEFSKDDFSIGAALAQQREHTVLIDWIMERGLNGPGRYVSDTEPSPGCMDRALVERVIRRHHEGGCSTLNALAALGMTGNASAVGPICEIQPQGSDEVFMRAVALRWLACESVQCFHMVLDTLPIDEEAVLLDVLWHAFSAGRLRVQAEAEANLASRLLNENWSQAPASDQDLWDRYDRLRQAIRERFTLLTWPPEGGSFPYRGYWPRVRHLSWDWDELRMAIRNGPAHEPAVDALRRYHALDSEAAYALAGTVLTSKFRPTSGVAELLVRFDAKRAASDLWHAALGADIRLQYEIAVALDQIEPRYLVSNILLDQIAKAGPKGRRLAIWLASWQTDGLLNSEIRELLDADLDVSLQACQALERQRRARQALAILSDLHGQSAHRRFVRVEAFLAICKPTDPKSPDGWAIWRRSGRPRVGALLWQRIRNGLRGARKFDDFGPQATRTKNWWLYG